jgi:hypothetical protein
VIGAAFEDATLARRVLEELRSRFDLRPQDAEVAPLGTSDPRLYVTLLAGRFQQGVINEVRRIIDQRGGRVVVDLEEWVTRPITFPPGRGSATRPT